MPIIGRDKLSYPAGVAPGFDPTHIAAQTMVFSGVALNSGNVLNLLTGKSGAVTGTISSRVSVIGPMFTTISASSVSVFTGTPTPSNSPGVIAAGVVSFSSAGAETEFIDANSGNVKFGTTGTNFQLTAGGVREWDTGIPVVSGVPYFLVGVFGPSTWGILVKRMDIGAVFTASTTASSWGPLNGTIGIGNGFNGGFNSPGNSTAAAMLAVGVLSASEMGQWADDPWSFWYPNNTLQDNFVGSSSASVSAALSGAACAALAGSFADAMAITIAGASISCVAGVLNDNVAPAFPGAAASISAGTLKDAVTVALAGAGSSISAGAFAAAVAKALTGAGASSAAGAFLEALALALTGAAASSAAGVFSDAVLDALSGAVASCAAGTLSASSSSGGTVSLTGASATIAAGLFADAIARALTGASSSASAGVLSPGNALNLAIAGASANALAGSLSVTEVGAVAGGSANAAAGNLAELASIALSGAGVTAGAGIIGKAVTVAPSGAQIAALAGFIVATRPGQVGLFGAFARASAGILVVSAISGSTGIFAFLDVHGAMSSEEFNELAARTG